MPLNRFPPQVTIVAFTCVLSSALFVDGFPSLIEDHVSLAAQDSLEDASPVNKGVWKGVGESGPSLSTTQRQLKRKEANGVLIDLAKVAKAEEVAKAKAVRRKQREKQAEIQMQTAVTAAKMKEAANTIVHTENKVDRELGKVLFHRATVVNAEHKEEAKELKYQKKAMAENALPKSEDAILVHIASIHKVDEGAPPADGLSDSAHSPNAAMRAQDRAMDLVNSEVAPSLPVHKAVKYNVKKAEMKAEKLGSGSSKTKTAADNCLTAAGECNPLACMCKKGHKPVPLKKTLEAFEHLKKSVPTVPNHHEEVMLGESDDVQKSFYTTAAVTKQVLGKQYENLPPSDKFSKNKAVVPAAEDWSEKMSEKFFQFDHPDKFQRQAVKTAHKAVKQEEKIDGQVMKTALDQRAEQHWIDAAKKAEENGKVKEQVHDADMAWKDQKKVQADELKIPQIATQQAAPGAKGSIAFGVNPKTGKYEPPTFKIPTKGPLKANAVEEASLDKAFAEEAIHQGHAIADKQLDAEKRLAQAEQRLKTAEPVSFLSFEEQKPREIAAMFSAVKLGDAKARVDAVLKARDTQEVMRGEARTSDWTMKHTAGLGKLMVVTQALDKAIANKKSIIKSLTKRLAIAHQKLKEIVGAERKIQQDSMAIVESTEERSREELGETGGNPTSLIQMSDSGDNMASLDDMSAAFNKIQKTMDDAAKVQANLEHSRDHKIEHMEKNLKHDAGVKIKKEKKNEVSLGEAVKVKKHESAAVKDQQRLQKKLDKEEAQIRMTTVKSIQQQHAKEKQINIDRKKQLGEAKTAIPAPVTRLDANMQTRMEYQGMILAQQMDLAEQKRVDLKNNLQNVRDNDRMHLRELTDDIGQKSAAMKADIDRIRMIRDNYERDHELGEGMDATAGAGGMARSQAEQEAKNLKAEITVADETENIMSVANACVADNQNGVVESAKQVLGIHSLLTFPGQNGPVALGENMEVTGTDTDSLQSARVGPAQIQLASRISVSKMELKLKLDKLQVLQKHAIHIANEARRIHSGAVAARGFEEASQARTAAMQNIFKELDHNVMRHENEMELGETIFNAKKEKVKEEIFLEEGESTGTRLTPLQDDIDMQSLKLQRAQAEIKHLDESAPQMIKDQIQVDKEKFGSVLKKKTEAYDKLKKRFLLLAASVSPHLMSHEKVQGAIDVESSRQGDYSHALDNIASYAKMVREQAKKAEVAAEGEDT